MEQNVVDQAVCAAVLQHQLKRAGGIPVNTQVDSIALAAGDTVTVESPEGSVRAVVEVRHLKAVELYRLNNGSAQFEGVNFRIEPAEGEDNV